MEKLPVFAIERHRITTDGVGVTTLVGAYGCPLQCKYCLNPHAWNPDTIQKCTYFTVEELLERVKVDDLYFKATGGGVTFGGGESLLHADFIKAFREVCPKEWTLTAETSLNVNSDLFETALEAVDAFIVDIKDMEPQIYKAYTGQNNEGVLRNLERLAQNLSAKQVRIRVPHIPGYNEEESIRASVEKLQKTGFTDIEVFPYVLRNVESAEKKRRSERDEIVFNNPLLY